MNYPINKILKSLKLNWNYDIPYFSWYDLLHYLTKEDVFIIKEVLIDFNEKKKVPINSKVLGIIIQYMVFYFEYDYVIKTIDFLKTEYGDAFVANSIRKVVVDPLSNNLDFDDKKIEHSSNYYLELLFQKDKKNKDWRNEKERQLNEICIPSFHYYFDKYKHKYGFSYLSPNKTTSSTNYGFFLDELSKCLKDKGINFDLTVPNTPWISLDETYKQIWEEKHEGLYFSSVYFLDRTLLTPKISKVLKDLLSKELIDLWIKLKIKNYIKRFFLLGGIELELLLLDNAYKFGFNFYQKHCSVNIWDDFKNNLSNLKNENNSKEGSYLNVFKTKFTNIIEDQFEEDYIFLVGCNHLEKDKYDDFIYYNIPFPDCIQFHELLQNKDRYYEYVNSFTDPENQIRTILGLPKIGEGWISETKLFYLAKEKFSSFRVIQHGKPKWLGKQHLDIYIPELNLGIEYQGKQHLMPIEIFGGEIAFDQNVKRDLRKKQLCKENNCSLYEVFPEDDFNTTLEFIYTKHVNPI